MRETIIEGIGGAIKKALSRFYKWYKHVLACLYFFYPYIIIMKFIKRGNDESKKR
jgi:hypothetical protein